MVSKLINCNAWLAQHVRLVTEVIKTPATYDLEYRGGWSTLLNWRITPHPWQTSMRSSVAPTKPRLPALLMTLSFKQPTRSAKIGRSDS